MYFPRIDILLNKPTPALKPKLKFQTKESSKVWPVFTVGFLIVVSLMLGCAGTGDKTSNITQNKVPALTSLDVPMNQAHLSPAHFNVFLLKQFPPSRHRITYSAEVAKALYWSGKKDLSRRVVNHAWTSLIPFGDLGTNDYKDLFSGWEEEGQALEVLAHAAYITGNTETAKEVMAVLGDDSRGHLEEGSLPVQQAISQAREGNLENAAATINKYLEDKERHEVFPRYFAWNIKALHREGKKEAAQALLAPVHRVLVAARKSRGSIPSRNNGRKTFPVSYLQDAAVMLPENILGLRVHEYCSFVEVFLLVNGQDQSKPLIQTLLEFSKRAFVQKTDESNPAQLLSDGTIIVERGQSNFEMQEAAIEGDPLWIIADLFIKAGEKQEAERLATFAKAVFERQAARGDSFNRYRHVHYWIKLARLSQGLKQKDQAITALDNALSLLRSFGLKERYGLIEAAVLYGRLGEEEKSKTVFNEALKVFETLKKQTAMLASAGHLIMNIEEARHELARENRALETFLGKLKANDKEAMQWAVFNLAFPQMGALAFDFNQASFGYLEELAGWPSFGHYYDDGAFSNSFSDAEKHMARQVVHVVMGGTTSGEGAPDLKKIIGAKAAVKKLPPWASNVSPDAALLMSFSPDKLTDLIAQIPEETFHETLREAIKLQDDIPKPLLNALVMPVVKLAQGNPDNVALLKPLLQKLIKPFLTDEYEQIVGLTLEMGLDVLSGNVGLAEQPIGFWGEIQPQAEGEDELTRPVVFAGAIPIKGGDEIIGRLEKIIASQKLNIGLARQGQYKVVDSEKITGLLGVQAKELSNTPFIVGIKDDQIVIVVMARVKMDIARSDGPEILEFKEGEEQIKAHFLRIFTTPTAKLNDLNPRHKHLLTHASVMNMYFSFDWMPDLVAEIALKQSLPASEGQLKLLKDAYNSAAFSMRLDLNPDGFVTELSAYHDKLDGKMNKTLPKELLRLLPNVSTVAGAYSFDADYLRTLIMEDFVKLMVDIAPKDEELDLNAAKENLEKEFERDNGIKLSVLLDNIPESILMVGPNVDQRLSEIGGTSPGILIGAKLRRKVKLQEWFDFIKKQEGLPESLDIKAELSKAGLYYIQKNGYLFLYSGEFKEVVEKGGSIGRKPRSDVAALIKKHGASTVIDGDFLVNMVHLQLSSQGVASEDEMPLGARAVVRMMELIDKAFAAIDNSVKGQATFRMGASFHPGSLGEFIQAMAIQAHESISGIYK